MLHIYVWVMKKSPQYHTRRNEKYFIQSTIIVSLGALWVPKEAKFFREVNIFGLVRYFSLKIEKTSKNTQNWPKSLKNSHFSVVFWSLFNFGWKTAHQTKNIEFPEEFRFIWYLCCPKTRDNSGAILSFMFCFEILWRKRPLVVFFFFSKWSLISS